MAFNVGTAFDKFCSNLKFTDTKLSTISTRYHNITKRINLDYWNSSSDTAHSLYVGSFGRDTEIFSSDIDMLVQMPYSTYQRFEAYSSNGQSALLQEVKRVIQKTYSSTALNADGQIISISFSDGEKFEVLPAFERTDGSFLFPNSNNGGSWKITDPRAEIKAINDMNKTCNYNLKNLCRMARAWKQTNSVPISGILIDVLAYRFLSNWDNRDKSYLYYDWMSRDFFKYLMEIPRTQTKWQVMGSGRYIDWYGSFQSKAKAAYDKAVEAINDETKYPSCANSEWREIYGNKFPLL